MSWLLFLDESGHDHNITPYEVRGGLASKPLVWHGDVYKEGVVHRSHGIVYIPDPYDDRRNSPQK